MAGEQGGDLNLRFLHGSCLSGDAKGKRFLAMVGYSYRGVLVADRPVLLEYLATTKIGEKGQLTVPKEFREDLGLGAGAPFCVLRMGNGLLLLPEQQRFDRLCAEISGTLTSGGITPE